MRRFDSIPRMPSPIETVASFMCTKAIQTERSPITTRRSDSIPKALPPLGTEPSLTRINVTTIEPSPITARRSDLIPTMLSLFAIEEKRSGISTTPAVRRIWRRLGSWALQFANKVTSQYALPGSRLTPRQYHFFGLLLQALATKSFVMPTPGVSNDGG